MLTLPHTLVGVALVSRLANPAVSLPLAFLSHYLLDMIPHWNWRPALKPLSLLGIFLDGSLSLAALFFFASRAENFSLILAGGLLPLTVDLFDVPYYFFGWRGFWEKYVEFNRRYQGRTSVGLGLLTQLLVINLALWLLL